MLQLENQRQRARETHSPVEIAATIDHEPQSNPKSRRGDIGNRGRPSHPRNSNCRFSSSSEQTKHLIVAHQLQTRIIGTVFILVRIAPMVNSSASLLGCSLVGFTTTMSYPTQPGWASSWHAPPTQQQHQGRPPQAHFAEVNPLEPSELGANFSTLTLDQNEDQWYMDSGATTHLTGDAGKISIPSVSSIKLDFNTGKLLTRHNSDGDLYPFTNQETAPTLSFFISSSSSFWHYRLVSINISLAIKLIVPLFVNLVKLLSTNAYPLPTPHPPP
uniref:Uncharacterized protein n=1 Tax=Lactuca sativa TaxID=4236 RepID=A0A9R1VE90_LACSA|nr:hypothetical protein LSAT_V11C500260770 [Lactuca sativa]